MLFLTKIRKVLKRRTWLFIGFLVLVTSGILLYFFFKKPYDPFDVDITDVKLELNFVDLNKELQSSDSTQLLKLREEYKKTNSEILSYILGGCLGIDIDVDSIYIRKLKDFYSFSDFQQIEQNIQKNQINDQFKNDLTDAFKRLKIHAPQAANQLFLSP